jgi:hypothetical protein
MEIKKIKSTKKTKKRNAKSKTKKGDNKLKNIPVEDGSFVIVDDEFKIDKDKEIEEKRAYLEEARSQDASD